jgi:hypothetical protein
MAHYLYHHWSEVGSTNDNPVTMFPHLTMSLCSGVPRVWGNPFTTWRLSWLPLRSWNARWAFTCHRARYEAASRPLQCKHQCTTLRRTTLRHIDTFIKSLRWSAAFPALEEIRHHSMPLKSCCTSYLANSTHGPSPSSAGPQLLIWIKLPWLKTHSCIHVCSSRICCMPRRPLIFCALWYAVCLDVLSSSELYDIMYA